MKEQKAELRAQNKSVSYSDFRVLSSAFPYRSEIPNIRLFPENIFCVAREVLYL